VIKYLTPIGDYKYEWDKQKRKLLHIAPYDETTDDTLIICNILPNMYTYTDDLSPLSVININITKNGENHE
jgi:hypothetical protein